MFNKRWIATGLLLASVSIAAQQTPGTDMPRTVVHDQDAEQLLLGSHRLSLQWISWDRFGEANVTETNGTLLIKGGQKSDENTDELSIEGVITQVDAKSFSFKGTIVTTVADINNGQPCTRRGEMMFRKVGARKYWRLKEMQNPCVGPGDLTTDYVDIYLR